MTAATKTWTGKISDSMCAATHKMVKEHEQKGEISKTAGNVINHRKASKSERMPV
jgi:hypothetical protein